MSAGRSRAGRRAREVALAFLFFIVAFAALPGVRADGSAAPASAGTATRLEPDAVKLFDEGNAAFHGARAHAESHPADHEGIARRYQAAAEKFAGAWMKGGASSELVVRSSAWHRKPRLRKRFAMPRDTSVVSISSNASPSMAVTSPTPAPTSSNLPPGRPPRSRCQAPLGKSSMLYMPVSALASKSDR